LKARANYVSGNSLKDCYWRVSRNFFRLSFGDTLKIAFATRTTDER
jgi:hypothetical protein